MKRKLVNPPEVAPPLGRYSHVADVSGERLIFIAGQVAVDSKGNLVGKNDFPTQARQVFSNIEQILKSLGLGWNNVAVLNVYLTDIGFRSNFSEIKADYMESFPPGVLVAVSSLVNPDYLIEIDAIAVAD